MSHVEFDEKVKKKRESMVNCSMAMLEAIRSYGFTATLDFVARISNYDPIVNEMLPYFPSIASVAMLEAWSTSPGSRNVEANPLDPAIEGELLQISARCGNGEIIKPI